MSKIHKYLNRKERGGHAENNFADFKAQSNMLKDSRNQTKLILISLQQVLQLVKLHKNKNLKVPNLV